MRRDKTPRTGASRVIPECVQEGQNLQTVVNNKGSADSILSFPRRREPSYIKALDPRLREDDEQAFPYVSSLFHCAEMAAHDTSVGFRLVRQAIISPLQEGGCALEFINLYVGLNGGIKHANFTGILWSTCAVVQSTSRLDDVRKQFRVTIRGHTGNPCHRDCCVDGRRFVRCGGEILKPRFPIYF